MAIEMMDSRDYQFKMVIEPMVFCQSEGLEGDEEVRAMQDFRVRGVVHFKRAKKGSRFLSSIWARSTYI